MSVMTIHNDRRGISLLEVLISMFILLVGLLGVASLLPVARFELVQAAKYDQGSTIGRATYRELKTRGLLDLSRLKYYTAGNYASVAATGGGWAITPPVLVVDPLFTTQASTTPSLPAPFPSVFPYCPISGGGVSQIYRATVDNMLPSMASVYIPAAAEQIFRGGDDLYYSLPSGSNDTVPEQRFVVDANSPPNPIRRIATGDYSWMYTLSQDLTSSTDPRDLLLSVVVFYKRPLQSLPTAPSANGPPPSERVVPFVAPPPVGYGGGELELQTSAANPNYLDVKVGQWILLGWGTSNGTVAPTAIRWYRVIGVQDKAFKINPALWWRFVTVAGADWFTTPPDAAFLCDGVIGVYEKNLRMQTP